MDRNDSNFWEAFETEETPEQSASFWDAFVVEPTSREEAVARHPLPELEGGLGLPRTSPITERTGVLVESRERLQAEREAKKEQEIRELSREVFAATGAEFDPDSTFGRTISPRELHISWELGRSLSTEAMQAKFKRWYPEGELQVIPTETRGNVTVVRENPTEPFREVSALSGVSGSIVSEAGFLGGVFSLAGPKGTAAGVALGELLRYEIELMRGYGQGATREAARSNAAIESAFAFGFDAATRRLFRFMGVSPKQKDAIPVLEARERLAARTLEEFQATFPELMEGQVSTSFIQGLMLQAGATGGRSRIRLGEQAKGLYEWFLLHTNAPPTAVLDDNSLALIASHARSQIDSLNTLGQISRAETGDLLRTAAPVWDRTVRTMRNRAYAEAGRLSQGVEFGNFSQVQSAVADMRVGVFARGRPTQRRMSIVDAEGNPLFEEVIPDIEIPTGQIQEMNLLFDAIESMDPIVSEYTASNGVTYSAVEQLARLRSRFFDLKNAENLDSNVYRQANEMWSLLTDVLDNPTTVGNPEFVDAFRHARTIHREHEAVLDNTFIRRLFRTNDLTPETIAQRFTSPNNGRLLAQVKDILDASPGTWEVFRNGVVNDLVNGSATPTAALSRLRRLERGDQPMLRMLMSPEEQTQLESLLQTRIRFESSAVNRALTDWSSEMDRAAEIYNNSTPDQLREIMGWAEDALGEAGMGASSLSLALRGYIMRDLLTNSTDTHVTAGTVVDAGLLRNRIAMHRKSGKLDAVLSQKDIDMILDLNLYALPVSKTTLGAGDSIATGAARAQIGQTLTDVFKGNIDTGLSLGQRLLSNDAISFYLTRPAVRQAYQPMPQTLEGRLRRQAFYMQLGLRDIYFSEPDESMPTQNLIRQEEGQE